MVPGGGSGLRQGDSERLSARQLGVTALVAGWAALPAGVGLGWRGALAALPAVLLTLWGLWVLLPRWERMGRSPWGWVLRAAYALWGTVLLGVELRRCALRIVHVGGADPAHMIWLTLLLALPLLWMARGKGAALFRAAELYYLIGGLSLLVLLGWALLRGDGGRMMEVGGAGPASALSVVGAFAGFLFVLPYGGWLPQGERSGGRDWLWPAALGLSAVLLPLAVSGVLGPALAARVSHPVLLMSAVLGGSARPESLVSMLWLFADYTRLGLLARSWSRGEGGRSRAAPLGAAAGILLAGWPAVERISPAAVGVGTLGLALLTALALLSSRKIVDKRRN